MNAMEYAKARNLPVVTIRRLCRIGKIPCLKVGRVYHLDEKIADRTLKELMMEHTILNNPREERNVEMVTQDIVNNPKSWQEMITATGKLLGV